MDPTVVFCPNLACPARGQAGEGNIGIHSRTDKRFICTECHKTFSATKGTALYRLRTSAEMVTLVITLMAHGCPLQAIVIAFGFDERTVAALGRAQASKGRQCRSIWWSNRVTSGRCKPMRSASRPKEASCGWRWP